MLRHLKGKNSVQLFTVKSVNIETFKAQTVWYSGLNKLQKMGYGPVTYVTSNK